MIFLSIFVVLSAVLMLSMCASAPEQPRPPVDAYRDLTADLENFVSSCGLAGEG